MLAPRQGPPPVGAPRHAARARQGSLALALACALAPATARAQEWTRFRGPNGIGISAAKAIPVTWAESDFRWRVALPGVGHSQPVIWGDRIFLTSASPTSEERLFLCLHKSDGRELWRKTYALPTHRPGSKNASFANGSPVVDRDGVIACFVSQDHFWVRCFDHAGQELWSRDLGTFTSQHGHGASPIFFENSVIVTNDQRGGSFIVALDRQTGRTLWQTPRRSIDNGTTYGTPCLYQRPGGPLELIVTGKAHGLASLDPRTGRVNWEAAVFDKRMCASPIIAGDLVIGSCGQGGGAGNYLAAVRLGGQGDVAQTHLAYTIRRATPYVPTPLYRDGRLYLISDTGIATVLDAPSGREIASERLRAEFFASPVMIDGRIYCASTKGELLVLAMGDTIQVLARNPLGEGTHSTPCVDGGRLYQRTFTHLLCLGGN